MRPNADEEARKVAREKVAREHLPRLLGGSELAPAEVALIAMQGFTVALSKPAPERREKFRAHIAALVEETRAPGELDRDESAAPPPVALASGCAVCKGLCCRHAGDAAHIDDAAVRRVRALWPELEEADVIALYVNAIPERTVERSCIVHGEHGCTLPRELRSQTCNEFLCVPVREWQEREGTQARPTAMVVVADDQVIRAGLLLTR